MPDERDDGDQADDRVDPVDRVAAGLVAVHEVERRGDQQTERRQVDRAGPASRARCATSRRRAATIAPPIVIAASTAVMPCATHQKRARDGDAWAKSSSTNHTVPLAAQRPSPVYVDAPLPALHAPDAQSRHGRAQQTRECASKARRQSSVSEPRDASAFVSASATVQLGAMTE